MYSLWLPVYVASAYGLDVVQRGGILRPPHCRGSVRLVYEHRSLLHRPTFAQRDDSDVWVMWHFV